MVNASQRRIRCPFFSA